MLTDDWEHSRLQDLEVARLRKDLEVMRADSRDSAAVLAQVRKLERAERSADRLSTRFVKRHGLAKLFEYRLAVVPIPSVGASSVRTRLLHYQAYGRDVQPGTAARGGNTPPKDG
jgi:hypothetical protein